MWSPLLALLQHARAPRRPHAEHPGVDGEQPVGSGGHCKGVREVGAIGGWPETRRDPAPVRSPLFIPPEVREVGAIGGWPETRRDPAPVLSALFIPPGDRETGTLRGWPDKGTTRLRYARAFTPGGRGRRGATRLRSASRSSLHAFHRLQGAHYSICILLCRTRLRSAAM